MKVLWIVNTIFPAPSAALKLSTPIVAGWMYGLADRVGKSEGITLGVATVYKRKELKKMTIAGVQYYLLPCKNNIKYDYGLEEYWKQVFAEFNPDIIHLHGTEYSHGLACMRAFPEAKYVVSIQGLVDVCAKYYLGGLTFWEITKSITFRDFLRNDNLFQAKNTFKRRGLLEQEYLRKTKHVIGRTQWDYVHTKLYNSKMQYHFCNESLRDKFYQADKWNIHEKEDFRIFCSQGVYPLKGLHQVLKAVALLKIDFPTIKLNIAGTNITKRDSLLAKIKISGYGFYLFKLIRQLGLEEIIEFTGPLDENQMINQYQKAHVFICSSSIENSPNSLGEAQILGTPVVASFVGGVPDMVDEGATGLLYRFEEFPLLAENIRRIFTDNILAASLSEKGILAASKRHDRDENLQQTLDIYSFIDKN
jgi:L-malate glycosyltransferase